jgi:hypothetical protein
MALIKDSTGYYLEPSSGQYYEQAPLPVHRNNMYGMNGNSAFGYDQMGFGGMNSLFGGNQRSNEPAINYITQDGMRYKPFTGSATGISAGIKSVIDSINANRQPYQYNVPSLAELFPNVQQSQPMQQYQGNAGAGRFMGGLLGTQMPTPVSSTTTQAPQSSGAGRFL